jgi:hypothetical protein
LFMNEFVGDRRRRGLRVSRSRQGLFLFAGSGRDQQESEDGEE